METKRLSLDQFKAKAEISNQTQELEKISGGVLGACHCDCCPSWIPDWYCDAVNWLAGSPATHDGCHE